MKNKKDKSKRRWVVLISILGFIFIAPFSSYLVSYQPQDEAKLAYQDASQYQGYYAYQNPDVSLGIIFYPGGLVNPHAYARFAQRLALATSASVFVSQPLWNLAITNIDAASSIMKANPNIESWVMGGHSLGGSSAAFFAHQHINEIQGLFFFASYTTEDADFSETSLPMLSITGSEDQILDLETYQEAERFHSTFTTSYRIEGGNHSQFGDYGFQRGDGIATISQEDQQTEIIMVMEIWLTLITNIE